MAAKGTAAEGPRNPFARGSLEHLVYGRMCTWLACASVLFSPTLADAEGWLPLSRLVAESSLARLDAASPTVLLHAVRRVAMAHPQLELDDSNTRLRVLVDAPQNSLTNLVAASPKVSAAAGAARFVPAAVHGVPPALRSVPLPARSEPSSLRVVPSPSPSASPSPVGTTPVSSSVAVAIPPARTWRCC